MLQRRPIFVFGPVLILHFIEVAEAAGAEKHQGEEEEVVAGVDQYAGGEGAGGEAHPAENQAYQTSNRNGPRE